jgi:hypothetical protein
MLGVKVITKGKNRCSRSKRWQDTKYLNADFMMLKKALKITYIKKIVVKFETL